MTCDLFLLAGQSNASGNGDPFDSALDAVIVPGVNQWDAKTQQVIAAVTPLAHHTAPPRVGFGYHFGVLYKLLTGREVVLIPRGKDSSRLRGDFWQPGQPGGEGFEDAVRESNAAIQATGGQFAGILWHQGEADTLVQPTEPQHRDLLLQLVAGLRARITGAENAIFLCGGMVPEWVAVTPAAAPIEAALASIGAHCPRTAYVPAEGLTGNEWPDDKIHFSAVSQRDFALRYLSTYLELAQGKIPTPASTSAPAPTPTPVSVPAPMPTPAATAPVVIPQHAAAAPAIAHTTPYRHKFSLVACARWEENEIVEWIEYHRAIGIDHFYIYSNDDTPTALFKVLAPYIFMDAPIVTYRHWPFAGQQPQIYFHFLETFLSETEWFCFLDIDEFMVFKNTDSISTFMSRFEKTHDAVYLNWLLYGNNHLLERDGDSVLFAYTRRSSKIDHHTKVITRAAAIDAAHIKHRYLAGTIGFWHFWNDYGLNINRITDAVGGSVENYTREFPKFAIEHIRRPGVSDSLINTAYVAHFQFKSERDFVRRAERGGFPAASNWQQIYEDGSYKTILNTMSQIEDLYLATFWARRCASYYETAAYAVVPRPDLPNIALRKPSTQSSRFAGEINAPNAHVQGHGNDGFRSGTFGFHTELEDAPWWEVNLLGQYVIKEIHIYNRLGSPGLVDRARHIAIETSLSGDDWTEIFANTEAAPFYGTTGGPLIVKLEQNAVVRYVRIISRARTFLHLDEVEIYGFQAV